MEKIGLFPLNIVLFPESSIPLHIFEDRYKLLVNRAIEDRSQFGINLSDPGIHNVGCTAEISKVLQRYSSGKLDVLVTGKKRYSIQKYTEGEQLYYVGEVEYFDDLDRGFDKFLLEECVVRYNEIIASLKDIKIDQIDIKELKTRTPSFLLAQKAGLTVKERQKLLEMKSENQRLTMLAYHLKKVVPMAKEAEQFNKIIRNDGYFNLKYFNP